jgi:hypothetical protein
MFRLLQSIFGVGEIKDGYPEWLIKKAVERAIDGTDPLLRAVSGYKKKLRPAVVQAVDYVVGMVNSLPPPVSVDLQRRGDDPLLRAVFFSVEEMRKVFGNDRNLAGFLRGAAAVPEKVVALLVMEKNEKIVYGAEMSGEVVVRDMPRMNVSFDVHRVIDPSGDEVETRRLLMRRAYDHLVSIALRSITTMKTERKELERRTALLQSKLNILRRGGWGFEDSGSVDSANIPMLEEQIGQIEARLMEPGGDDRMLEVYLDILVDVLSRPGEHLWGKKDTLILDSMGIKRNQVASNVNEVTFHELFNSEGQRLVVLLVAINSAEILNLCR